MDFDNLYDETSATGEGIPKWVLEDYNMKAREGYDMNMKAREDVVMDPDKGSTDDQDSDTDLNDSSYTDENGIVFTSKFCEIDIYTPCIAQGIKRKNCNHYVCDLHFNKHGWGYNNIHNLPITCGVCLYVYNNKTYVLARFFKKLLYRKKFKLCISQIKISRWWRKYLFIKRINQLISNRHKKELEKKQKDNEYKRGRLAWIERLEKQNKQP